jgi:hypothetical protein
MPRRAVPLALLAFVVFANTAQAASISVCTAGIHCDFSENGATTGIINPLANGAGLFPDWLVGYTFLLEAGTSYAGAANNGNISDVVVFHSGFAELFSVLDSNFLFWLNSALSLSPIDGTPLSAGQVVGTPFFPGAQQFGGVGLVNENALGIANVVDIAFVGGQGDSITITSAPAQSAPATVPEPATLSLLSIGLLGGAACRWRSHRVALCAPSVNYRPEQK